MTTDLEAVRKLEEQLRADDRLATKAPWKGTGYHVWQLADGSVVAECKIFGDRGDDADGIARTRNALPIIADTTARGTARHLRQPMRNPPPRWCPLRKADHLVTLRVK